MDGYGTFSWYLFLNLLFNQEIRLNPFESIYIRITSFIRDFVVANVPIQNLNRER